MTINQVLLLLPFFLADVSSTTAKKRKEKITGEAIYEAASAVDS